MKINHKITTFAIASIAGLVTALSFATPASAWGPERETFTMESPASFPTFNSITDNPTIGDERDFVRVGEIDADVTDLQNEVTIVPGRQYLVYVYYHNNASSTYNGPDYDYSGIARAVRMSSTFSKIVTPDSRGTITATITSDNTAPASVWDEAYMTTDSQKVLLSYVAGSAKIYNDWGANGSIMPTSLFTETGALLGLNELNGMIPGCEEYHGVVTYVLQASALAGTVEKTVSTDGENYSESLSSVTPGTELYFKLTLKNAGDVALTNAVIKDSLPDGLTLVPGSVEFTANDSGVKDQFSDNLIGTGYNLGTFGTGNVAYITYRATVGEDFDCDGLDLVNTATFIYDSDSARGDSSESSATVHVQKDGCAVVDTPEEELPTEIVNTGPAEIIMAVIVVLGICGGIFYLYRTRHAVKTVENEMTGASSASSAGKNEQPDQSHPEEKQHREE